MTNNKDIIQAEIKNLYALEKQSIQTLEIIQNYVTQKKLAKRIAKNHERSAQNLKNVHNYLKAQEINPGNVTDSIMQEIHENFTEIVNLDLPQSSKDLSLWMSLNRMMSYKIACYQNAYVLTQKSKDKIFKKNLINAIKKYQKELTKLHSKTCSKLLKNIN